MVESDLFPKMVLSKNGALEDLQHEDLSAIVEIVDAELIEDKKYASKGKIRRFE
jgi:hypothetical protein